jgi:plasmid stability protein
MRAGSYTRPTIDDLGLTAATGSSRMEDGTPMATLNVKNLPDGLYRKLQARARRERRSVAQEVTRILSESLSTPRRSILELRGLGKRVWRGTDAAGHVARERASWD